MAKNPFTSISDVTRKIGKNYYDWSHDYNFTGKIGTIYPVFAKYCPAGQSLSIDAVAGLQFMPMQFPVQSKMKMKISFWRMPLRAMWKDYTNLVSSQNQPDVQKDYVAPYIDFNHSNAYRDMLCVGGLCDYLRIPVVSSYAGLDYEIPFERNYWNVTQLGDVGSLTVGGSLPISAPNASPKVGCSSPDRGGGLFAVSSFDRLRLPDYSYMYLDTVLGFPSAQVALDFYQCLELYAKTRDGLVAKYLIAQHDKASKIVFEITVKFKDVRLDGNTIFISTNPGEHVGDLTSASFPDGRFQSSLYFPWTDNIFQELSSSEHHCVPRFSTISCRLFSRPSVPLSSANSPYFDSSSSLSEKQLKISAYPFRMYEAIYNAYIRYIRNNPFKKNGKAVYNEWLPTMEGGADKTPYKLYRCNWAADAYTTAVQSPQQGVAPVVGLSQATVTAEDGVSRVVPAITTEDGRTYGIEFKANEFGLEGVDYTELGTGAKVAPVHSMYSLAQSGISIEDFRMTNAYQRYLELNMMRGYSYKQIVEGRFEVNVKYDDLLMPEFCGGMTRDVFMSGVQQNVEDNGGSGSYIGSLGSEAGVAGCRGDLGHKIKIYCDEASYVMALAYVVPQSIYSQICPKDFLYRDLLDAWTPEFDQIGFQPIKYSELCPVESWANNPDRLTQTFGFQRPWHEYCEVPDASVGLFNTELRNFLMHRVFSSSPVLGQKFTTVNSESVDHVFSVTEFTDKFFGQIHFSIDVKSPVSRVVIPSLE